MLSVYMKATVVGLTFLSTVYYLGRLLLICYTKYSPQLTLERTYKTFQMQRFKLGCDLIKSPFSILPQRDTVSMPKFYSLSFCFFI